MNDVIPGVFIVNFVQIFTPFSNTSIGDLEQKNICWKEVTRSNCKHLLKISSIGARAMFMDLTRVSYSSGKGIHLVLSLVTLTKCLPKGRCYDLKT